jgi:hypothetical protein
MSSYQNNPHALSVPQIQPVQHQIDLVPFANILLLQLIMKDGRRLKQFFFLEET